MTPTSSPDPDAPKRSLEEEKLRLEISQLSRPWFLKPEYLSSAIALMLGIGTLIVAWASGLFDVNSKLLEMKRHDLSQDVANFESRKRDLEGQNNKLTQDNARLNLENSRLVTGNEKLASENKLYARRVTQLRSDARLADLELKVGYLQRNPLSLDDRLMQEVNRTIQNSPRNSPEINFASSIAVSILHDSSLRIAMCVPLWRATNEPRWRSILLELAGSNLDEAAKMTVAKRAGKRLGPVSKDEIPDFELDAVRSVATVEQKAAILRSLHSILGPHFPEADESLWGLALKRTLEYRLAQWDSEATAAYAEFWLDQISHGIRLTMAKPSSMHFGTPGLAMLSPQAALILALEAFERVNEDLSVPVDRGNCGSIPKNFPITCETIAIPSDPEQQYLVFRKTRMADYSSWLAGHPRLVSLFLDPEAKGLRSAAPKIRSRAIRREWIAESEAP